jgi:hypothetical protein
MKNKFLNSFVICFIMMGLIACSQNKEEIETVKNAPTTLGMDKGGTFIDLIAFIAGSDSDVKWKAFSPEGTGSGPETVCVEVDITRNTDDIHSIMIQHLLNRKTGQVKVSTIEIDGKKVSVDSWYEILLKIYAQKGYK